MTAKMDYEPQYLAGIKFFNACEFYEAHEVWEDLWTESHGPSRCFYQGLIQLAVALHHFGNGNHRGAKKLYHSSRSYLQPYLPSHLGCDTEQLFVEMEECFQELLRCNEDTSGIEIDPEWIPEIHLDPSLSAVGGR
jgi:predicted metal-dependent hydrolase